jgi:flagellar biogenesis protein FliO
VIPELLSLIGVLAVFLTSWLVRKSIQRRANSAPRLPSYADRHAAERANSALSRLSSPNDRYFLRFQRGYQAPLERRLALSRKTALKLYLRQYHSEFRRLMTAAAEVARTADSEFGSDLVSLSLRFHLVYFVAWSESRLLGRLVAAAPYDRMASIMHGLKTDLAAQQSRSQVAPGV